VAGKLSLRESSYISCITGKKIKLKMYLPPQRIKQADFAMYAVKAAFAWYEAAWGLSYQEVSRRGLYFWHGGGGKAASIRG